MWERHQFQRFSCGQMLKQILKIGIDDAHKRFTAPGVVLEADQLVARGEIQQTLPKRLDLSQSSLGSGGAGI